LEGTINHVDLVNISRELRILMQHVIDDVAPFAKSRHGQRHPAAAEQNMAHPKPLRKLVTKAHL